MNIFLTKIRIVRCTKRCMMYMHMHSKCLPLVYRQVYVFTVDRKPSRCQVCTCLRHTRYEYRRHTRGTDIDSRCPISKFGTMWHTFENSRTFIGTCPISFRTFQCVRWHDPALQTYPCPDEHTLEMSNLSPFTKRNVYQLTQQIGINYFPKIY